MSAARSDSGFGPITLANVDAPIVILFVALVASPDLDRGLRVAWNGCGGNAIEAVCWQGSLILIEGAPGDLLAAGPAEITLQVVAREPKVRAIAVDPRRQRDAVEIDEATWRRVAAYADRLLVVATETSRLTGAGAGVVDTD